MPAVSAAQERSPKCVDRPLKDILMSMATVISKPATSDVQAQFKRDLEKLCIVARMSPQYERGE
jgi:hypothetical protein